jgi:hypothetical protein
MGRTEGPTRAQSGLVAVLAAALLVTGFGLRRGPGQFVRNGGAPWVVIVPTTFEVWDTRPIREHMFLTFLSRDEFARGRAYTGYTHPWLFLEYAFLAPWRWGGVSYERSQVFLCVPQFLVIVALALTHLRHAGTVVLRQPLAVQNQRLAVVALALAGVFTLPSFWIGLIRFNPEHSFFVPALAFGHLAAMDARGAIDRPSSWLALAAIALFAPTFMPFAVVSWIFLWGTDRRRIGRLTVLAAVAAAAFLLPKLAALLTPYTVVDSGFTFRSGLDGSDRYFTSMLQAVLAPSYPPGRAWFVWPWPVAALLAIGVAGAYSRPPAAGMARRLFVCWLPFLWTTVVFPQAVSVHPYMFDFQLRLGAALCILVWLQAPELRGWTTSPAGRLAILIVLVGLVMTNLIDLARMRVVP